MKEIRTTKEIHPFLNEREVRVVWNDKLVSATHEFKIKVSDGKFKYSSSI